MSGSSLRLSAGAAAASTPGAAAAHAGPAAPASASAHARAGSSVPAPASASAAAAAALRRPGGVLAASSSSGRGASGRAPLAPAAAGRGGAAATAVDAALAAGGCTPRGDALAEYVAAGPIASVMGLTLASVSKALPTWQRLGDKLATQLQLEPGALTPAQWCGAARARRERGRAGARGRVRRMCHFVAPPRAVAPGC
jgi:hypothetical protein